MGVGWNDNSANLFLRPTIFIETYYVPGALLGVGETEVKKKMKFLLS